MLEEIPVFEFTLPTNVVRGYTESNRQYLRRCVRSAIEYIPQFFNEVNHPHPLVRTYARGIIRTIQTELLNMDQSLAVMGQNAITEILNSGVIQSNRVSDFQGLVFFIWYVPVDPSQYLLGLGGTRLDHFA